MEPNTSSGERSLSEDSLEIVVSSGDFSSRPTPPAMPRASLPSLPRHTPSASAIRRMTRELPGPLAIKRLAQSGPKPQAAAAMLAEPSPEAPQPFGQYELIRRIGAGGMGEVFLAREPSPAGPRACVVKKVLPSLQENRAFVGRFLDEAKVVVQLSHPNIARVYAMGEVNGEYYLTMEYVQGKTVSRFAKRLRDKKLQMPLGVILLIGERVCQGLQYAHHARDAQGAQLHLVHRDLSPANVCISYRGEVKIIDFGAAQSSIKEEQTAPRVVIGNLTYMAPEQAKKQLVDARADLYSCGVMLWELLAWHALPQKGDPIERWRRAANPSWEAPSLYHGEIPIEIDQLVLRTLKKDPDDRFRTAAELQEALKQMRLRFAPSVTDADIGELLTRAFRKEKEAEDAVLQETLGGVPIADVPTDKTKRLHIVPPTALAFEHTAVLGPVGYVPENDELTDPGRAVDVMEGTPTPDRPILLEKKKQKREPMPLGDEVGPTRTGFGVTFSEMTEPQLERSLIAEIEGAIGSGEEEQPEYATAAYGDSSNRFILIGAGVFFAAVGLGFLGIWLLLQYR